MTANRISCRSHIYVTIALLTCLGLSTLSARAQTFAGQSMLPESPASLRTIITPASNSSIIRVRFENQGRGSVHIQIRDTKGTILLDESQPKRLYAGQFDLASLPTGLYTIELRTLDARHTETIRIDAPVAGHVVAVSGQTEPVEKLIVQQ